MSLDDYKAFEETAYLLKSHANTKRLRDSIAQIEAAQTKKHNLVQKWTLVM